MKKFSLCLVLLMTMSAGALMAQDYPASEFNFRLGIQYPDAPERVGLDTALNYNYWVNPFFAVGAETGFGWINREFKGGSMSLTGVPVPLGKSTDMNIFSLPVLAKLTIGLSSLRESIGIMPYIAGGAGYSWQFYRMKNGNDTFHGFTWEALGGVAVSLGESANGMELLVEAGYRGTDTQNQDDWELDMSGLIVHVGASFPLSSGE